MQQKLVRQEMPLLRSIVGFIPDDEVVQDRGDEGQKYIEDEMAGLDGIPVTVSFEEVS